MAKIKVIKRYILVTLIFNLVFSMLNEIVKTHYSDLQIIIVTVLFVIWMALFDFATETENQNQK